MIRSLDAMKKKLAKTKAHKRENKQRLYLSTFRSSNDWNDKTACVVTAYANATIA